MVPVLPPGTLIVAWVWFMRLRPGQVVVFWHNGMEKVKRIHHITGEDIYVIGDHVDASTDSRHFGPVKREDILAIVVYPRVQIWSL